MKNPDQLWYDIAQRFAKQSQCKSRQVGAILVKDKHLIGQGWNSAPEGSTCDDCPRAKCKGRCTISGKDMDLAICCHAEANALGYCARFGIAIENSILYCTHSMCSECAKLVVACKIKEVVYNEEYPHFAFAKKILKNAKIKVRKFKI